MITFVQTEQQFSMHIDNRGQQHTLLYVEPNWIKGINEKFEIRTECVWRQDKTSCLLIPLDEVQKMKYWQWLECEIFFFLILVEDEQQTAEYLMKLTILKSSNDNEFENKRKNKNWAKWG